MSRALDLERSELSKQEEVRAIFNDIANVLCPTIPTILEIEFLGKSHPLPPGSNVQVDGNSIALSKGKLVHAFLYARALFFDKLQPCPHEKEADLLRATAIILLMDAEHLTAANARKRVLMNAKSGVQTQYKAALQREMLFVDSYLTSRLHRHTKSPTIWSHRRWLLERQQEAGLHLDLSLHLKTILTAAERHPRNYYAWLHLRWLVQQNSMDLVVGSNILGIVKDWALKHPSDTSGFSFLQFYLDHITKSDLSNDARYEVFSDVLVRTESFNWTYESIWVFLRTLAASNVSPEQESIFIRINSELAASKQEDNGKALRVLQNALQWYQTNRLAAIPR